MLPFREYNPYHHYYGYPSMSSPSSPSHRSPERAADQADSKERKRRRIYRACDYCRLRKSKCDGKIPCAGCVSIGHDCAYSDSQRSRRGGPRYIEELEGKIRNLEQILRTVQTEERIESAQNRDLIAEGLKDAGGLGTAAGRSAEEIPPTDGPEANLEAQGQDELLETMIEATGHLHLDIEQREQGSQSQVSGLRALQRFGMSLTQDSPLMSPATYSPDAGLGTHTSISQTPDRDGITPLPAKKTAIFFVDVAINHALCLMNFVHRPTVYEYLDSIYGSDLGVRPEFQPRLALLYGLFALGALFSGSRIGEQEITSPAGLAYFQACQDLVDPMELRDMASLQALLCIVMFMQGTGMVTRSYSLTCAATSAAVRMGLHRSVTGDHFSLAEQETRKRVFWILRTMDTYITSMLGLPKNLSEEDIDQELPKDVDDSPLASEITSNPSRTTLMSPVVAHIKLVQIMSRAVKDIYPTKKPPTALTYTYGVSASNVTEVESELQHWFEELSLSGNSSAPSNSFEIRTQLLLRMAYGHAQMVLYRPFLHHILKPRSEGNIQIRSYACASACIKAAMQVIWLAEELDARGLIHEAYWFTPYIASFAVITLYLFVLTSREDPTWQETRDTADRGRAIVLKMSRTNPMAEWCMSSLALSPFTHVENAEEFFPPTAMDTAASGVHHGGSSSRPLARGSANIPLQSSLSLHHHPAFHHDAAMSAAGPLSLHPGELPPHTSHHHLHPQDQQHQHLRHLHPQQHHLLQPTRPGPNPTSTHSQGSGDSLEMSLSAMPYVPLSPFAMAEGTSYFDVQNPALAVHEAGTPFGLGHGPGGHGFWFHSASGSLGGAGAMNWTPGERPFGEGSGDSHPGQGPGPEGYFAAGDGK